MARTKWLDRKFNFDFPVGNYTYIIERLRGTPARIEEKIAACSASMLTERAGGWSINEHVGHLGDLEELWNGRLDDFEAGKERLRPADLTNAKTEKANHNATSTTELVKRFRDTRQALVHRFEGLGETGAAMTALHPRLEQPMRVVDMAYFIAEHDDHHLAIVTNIARNLSSK